MPFQLRYGDPHTTGIYKRQHVLLAEVPTWILKLYRISDMDIYLIVQRGYPLLAAEIAGLITSEWNLLHNVTATDNEGPSTWQQAFPNSRVSPNVLNILMELDLDLIPDVVRHELVDVLGLVVPPNATNQQIRQALHAATIRARIGRQTIRRGVTPLPVSHDPQEDRGDIQFKYHQMPDGTFRLTYQFGNDGEPYFAV